jgi:hypothetical protein
LAAAASRAAARHVLHGSNASPSLITTMARSPAAGDDLQQLHALPDGARQRAAGLPTTSGSRLSRKSSIAPASVVSGERM